MKRSRLITAVAVAAALSLAACSNSGTPEAASTPGTSQQPPAAGASSSAAAGGTSSEGAAASSESAGASSQAGGDTAGQSSEAGGDGSSGQSTEQSTITVGGGDLDAQSAAWFNTFCAGMAPLAELDDTMTTVDPNDPQKMRDSYVSYFNTLGDAMINTSDRLKSTPPPTFDKGPEIADKIVTALGKAGPAIKESATKLESADITDAASLTEAMDSASQTMSSQMDDLSLDGYELDPKTEAAVENLPACAVLNDTTGG
jgi:hypothetical protein